MRVRWYRNKINTMKIHNNKYSAMLKKIAKNNIYKEALAQ